jgi:hypothetical protein
MVFDVCVFGPEPDGLDESLDKGPGAFDGFGRKVCADVLGILNDGVGIAEDRRVVAHLGYDFRTFGG